MWAILISLNKSSYLVLREYVSTVFTKESVVKHFSSELLSGFSFIHGIIMGYLYFASFKSMRYPSVRHVGQALITS